MHAGDCAPGHAGRGEADHGLPDDRRPQPSSVPLVRRGADKLFHSVAPTGSGHLGLIVREPVGVVAAVLPWNFPALMFAWKVALPWPLGTAWSSSHRS